MKSDESSMSESLTSKNFDELIVALIGEVLQGRLDDESLAIRQICQTFPPSKFCTIRYAI